MKKFFIIFVFLSLLVACGSEKNENSSTTTNTTSEISQSKMLNYDFMIEQNIKTVKLQGDVPLDFVNGEIPTFDEMKLIAEDIAKKYPNYQNYFINFKFPLTDTSEKRNETDYNSLCLFTKSDNSDFRLVPHYNNIPTMDLTLNKNIVGHLGINLISNISPIKEGMSLSQVKEKLGEPAEINNETKESQYYILNENYQVLGILFIQYTGDNVKVANFFSLNNNFSKEQLSAIDSYIAGNLKLEDLKIKELKDIY